MSEYMKKIEEFKQFDAFKGMLEVHNTFRHNQPQNGSSDGEWKQWRERVAKQAIDDFKHKILQLTARSIFRRKKITISESFPMQLADEIIDEASHQPSYKVKKKLEDCEYSVYAAKQTIDDLARFFSPEKQEEFDNNSEIVIEDGNHSHILHGDSQKNRFKKELLEEKMIDEEGLKLLEEPIPALKQEFLKRLNSEAVEAIIKQAQELNTVHWQLSRKAKKITEQSIVPDKDAKTFIDIRERMRLIESELSTLEAKFNWHETSPKTLFPSLDSELTSSQLQHQYYNSEFNAKVKEIERIYRESLERKDRKEATKKA